jgi:hypothetical protein
MTSDKPSGGPYRLPEIFPVDDLLLSRLAARLSAASTASVVQPRAGRTFTRSASEISANRSFSSLPIWLCTSASIAPDTPGIERTAEKRDSLTAAFKPPRGSAQ